MATDIDAHEQEVVDALNAYEDWLSIYSYLIDSTLFLERMTLEEASRAHHIKDCQSDTWMLVELDGDGRLHIKADSEALIVKGLAGLLLRIFNGSTPEEAASFQPTLAQRTMLSDELGATRLGGLSAMTRFISDSARTLMTQ